MLSLPHLPLRAAHLPPCVFIETNGMRGQVIWILSTRVLCQAPLDPCLLAVTCEWVTNHQQT